MFFRLQLVNVILLSVIMLSCTQQPAKQQQVITSLSKEIKEIHEGILEGYLSKEEIPNSLMLVPPPPKEGSAAFQLDQEMAAMYVASDDEARKEQATQDAVLSFPEATEAFNIVLNVQISEENTPLLYMILRRTLADAGLATYAAKNHYQRARPFMLNNTPICTPDEEAILRKDGSYPSGHTAIGWAWALILAEVFPDQADVILERGKQFGISRNVCNVHWHSDVVYGRMMGAATVAKLHSNNQFMIDLSAAKEEIAKLIRSL
ncbi:phosphatase PAP2 family protein [Desulfosarcina sp.]|nr:phosphatase PAP2 family protein [Desulfosarcina sp.]